ncbi:MAG: LamB/YcsF family protein, partial [Verrucomicrobiota bacterium]
GDGRGKTLDRDARRGERRPQPPREAHRVRTWDGGETPLRAETLCLHGDGSDPVGFARRLRSALAAAGVAIQGFPAPVPR